jgi:hypothetical protein
MKKTSFALLALVLAAPAAAVDWNTLGARATGMGGAGVAVPQGPTDVYWNPANLGAIDSKTGGQVPVTAHFALTGSMIEGANDMDAIANDPSLRTPANASANISAALSKFGAPGNGVRADVGTGLDLKFGRWAVFANGFGYMGAIPQADLVNTTANDFANKTNNSALIIHGIQVSELGVGHGRELPFAEGVFVGGDVKLMSGRVGYASAFILREDQEYNDLFKRMKDGSRTSANLGVDLGVLWDVERTFGSAPLRPRLGLTARDINNPGFKQPDAAVAAGAGDKFKLNPQARFGASIAPTSWWTVATDLDLTRNLTTIGGVASRQWSLGTEFNVVNAEAFNIPLRLGLLRNLADGRSGTMVTFGGGLNLAHFHLDASAAISPKKVQTQSLGKDEKFPREATLGLALGFMFGGSRDELDRPADVPGRPSAAPSRDEQPVSTEKVKESMDKAQKELDKESDKKR